MSITATTLAQLDANKSYYLSNTTRTIKEAGFWQRFKCWTGWGDGREKVQRLAEAVKSALLADAAISSEAKLSEELEGLNKNESLSGASIRQIATRFKADHAAAIAASDAYREAERIADGQIKMWIEQHDVLPEEQSLGYIKKLALYAAQQVTNNAIDYINDPDPKKLARRIRSSMNNVIYCLNAAENMKRRDLGYPRTETYTDANGKKCTLNPPRLRLDELHFRAILGIMSTKDGPATFSNFITALVRNLPEEELQKRKDVILGLKLEEPNKPGSALAFAAQVAKSAEIYNGKVLSGINPAASCPPPAAFTAAEDEVVAEMRARFGEDAIEKYVPAKSLMTYKEHTDLIAPLVEQANGEGRTIGAEEIKNAIRGKCITGAANKVIYRAFKEIAAERKFKGDDILSLSFRFGMQYPAIVEEVAACETPAAARAAIRRHEDEIAARLQLQADLEEARAELPARAAAMIAKATGMSVEHVSKRLNADRLMLKAGDFRDSILLGKVEGADKPGFDIRAAYQGVLDKFVNGRLALMAEVDKITDLSDDLKRKWKNHIISTYKAEALNPAKIHKLLACGHFSDKLLVEALDTPGTAQAAKKICSYMGGVNAHFVELFGEDEWEDMGDDERDPVLSMALMGVIDKNPAVAEKFLSRKDELMDATSEEFNRDDFVAQGHGRKIVEGLYAILVGIDGRKEGE